MKKYGYRQAQVIAVKNNVYIIPENKLYSLLN